MKKNMKLSLIVVLVLVMGGIGVLIKFRKKTIDPENIVEISMTKKEATKNIQKFDDPGISKSFIKQFGGNEKILEEQLNMALEDMEAILVEIRTAMLEGRLKRNTGGWTPPNSGNIETSTGNNFVSDIDDNGTFRECIKRSLSNAKEHMRISFCDDKKTLQSCYGPHGYLGFTEDGTLYCFQVSIDGKRHAINWKTDGKIKRVRANYKKL